MSQLQERQQQQTQTHCQELERAHQRDSQQMQSRLVQLETSCGELSDTDYQNQAALRDLKAKLVAAEKVVEHVVTFKHICSFLAMLNDLEDCKVSSKERAKLCFRAAPCKARRASLDRAEMFTFADVNLSDERIVSSATPCGDFFFRCRRTSKACRADTCSSGSRTPSGGRSLGEDLVRVVNECDRLDLNIIVIWKAYVVEDSKQLILEGQLHVALQAVGEEATSLAPKQDTQEMVLLKFKSDPPPPTVLPSTQLSRLIKSNLRYSETYAHDFAHDSVCVVPVCLVLSNCCRTDVDITVDLRHKTTSSEWSECACSFTWVGQTRYRLALCPRQTRHLELQACFLMPGVYNINTHAVCAAPCLDGHHRDDANAQTEVAQHGAGPALIVITDSSQ
ncbi:trafficking protein particle complex subunit 8-like [Syngnathus typhle]|uniref:trafficking protein particle complex subunit 8-like n=1 Tax=Syngnathus typhle TaxID=161592 RepID=UPI002A6AA82B|nr:trafficking protein particle complex subunit 8-like [Syngnathus typhle]